MEEELTQTESVSSAPPTPKIRVKRWRPEPGPIILLGPHNATSAFAASDAELVAGWLKEKYGLTVLTYFPLTPTYYGMAYPVYGWKRANEKN